MANNIQNKCKDKSHKIKGVTMVAPPKKFVGNPMTSIKQVNAEWISLIPYAFTPKNKPELHYGNSSWQWWGETSEGIRSCAELAHQNGLKIMLKPQVYIHGSWTGVMEFQTEAEWRHWEKDYETYIMNMLKIAIDQHIEMFCIGTEFCKSSELRNEFWIHLIQKIKAQYKGLLTYSDNWDHFKKVLFWDQLDYIGISAYFPLIEKNNPSVIEIKESWKFYLADLELFSKKINKKILFTEYGYLSVDGASGRSWELENNIEQRKVNQQAQSNCYQALYEVLWSKDFWEGGFIWKWFPEDMGHEDYPERDYTPQHKLAEKIVHQWYGKE